MTARSYIPTVPPANPNTHNSLYPRGRYVGPLGGLVESRTDAARFDTSAEAMEFARRFERRAALRWTCGTVSVRATAAEMRNRE